MAQQSQQCMALSILSMLVFATHLSCTVLTPSLPSLSHTCRAYVHEINLFIGLATHNLTEKTGQKGVYGTAYGHKGATYGYQSLVGYMPGLDFSLAIATNLERNLQEQPADVFCIVYNRLRNLILDQPLETCVFVGSSYDGSNCNCSAPAR
jgi:hypothetical protein